MAFGFFCRVLVAVLRQILHHQIHRAELNRVTGNRIRGRAARPIGAGDPGLCPAGSLGPGVCGSERSRAAGNGWQEGGESQN